MNYLPMREHWQEIQSEAGSNRSRSQGGLGIALRGVELNSSGRTFGVYVCEIPGFGSEHGEAATGKIMQEHI